MRQYLKELREEKGLTQQEVAEQMGMRPNYYCMIETGSRQIDMNLSVAEKLSKVFDLPVERIIEEENRLKG